MGVKSLDVDCNNGKCGSGDKLDVDVMVRFDSIEFINIVQRFMKDLFGLRLVSFKGMFVFVQNVNCGGFGLLFLFLVFVQFVSLLWQYGFEMIGLI